MSVVDERAIRASLSAMQHAGGGFDKPHWQERALSGVPDRVSDHGASGSPARIAVGVPFATPAARIGAVASWLSTRPKGHADGSGRPDFI